MIGLSVQGITSRSTLPNGRRIVTEASFQAAPGQLTAVVGPSGAGKSTLLDVITGIAVPASGSVLLGTTPMHPANSRRRSYLRARVFASARQDGDLIDALSVDENVLLGQRLSRVPDRRLAEDVLAALGLDRETRRTAVQTLSGGQRRRVALARALASGTRMVACDEPTTALDQVSGDLVRGLLSDAVQGGRTVLVVTHDPELVARADRVVQLAGGRTTAVVDRPDRQTMRQLMRSSS